MARRNYYLMTHRRSSASETNLLGGVFVISLQAGRYSTKFQGRPFRTPIICEKRNNIISALFIIFAAKLTIAHTDRSLCASYIIRILLWSLYLYYFSAEILIVLWDLSSLLHLSDILIILYVPVERLSPHLNSIIRPPLKLRLCHLLFEIPGVMCFICLMIHAPDWVSL